MAEGSRVAAAYVEIAADLKKLADGLAQAKGQALTGAVAVRDALARGLQGAWDSLPLGLRNILSGLADIGLGAGKAIASSLKGGVRAVGDVFTTMARLGVTAMARVWGAAGMLSRPLVNAFMPALREVGFRISNFFDGTFGNAMRRVGGLITRSLTASLGPLGGMLRAVVGPAAKALDGAFGAVSGTMRALGGVGKVALGSLQLGLQATMGLAKAAATGVGLLVAAVAGLGASADTSGTRLNSLLRSTAQQAGFSRKGMDQLAGNIQKQSGGSGREARQAQAALLQNGAVRGDLFKDANNAVADLAVNLGTTVPEAAKKLGSALQAPVQGIQLLKEMGQTISPVFEEQFKNMAEATPEGFEKAQQYIMQRVKAMSAGSAEEMKNSAAGAWASLQASFVDTLDTIAPMVAPILEQITKGFKDLAGLIDFQAVGAGLKSYFETINTAMQGIRDLASPFVAIIGEGLVGAFHEVKAVVTGFFEYLSTAIGENRSTFEGWATSMTMIWDGVTGGLMGAWQGFVSFFQDTMTVFTALTGATWGGVSDVVTSALDTIAMYTSNWKKTFEIAWLAIKLGALVAFDAVSNGFWVIISAGAGAIAAVKTGFWTLWDNLSKVATLIKDTFKGVFSAIGAAFTAILKMKNPAEAFQKEFAKQMKAAAEAMDPLESVGDKMTDAYKKGYDSIRSGHMGESQITIDTRRDLEEAQKALADGYKKLREEKVKQIEEAKKAEDKAKEAVKKGSDTGLVTPESAPATLPSMIKVKFETVGLQDMWKRVQTSVTGGGMSGLQQRQTQAAEENMRTSRLIEQNTRKMAEKDGTAVAG